MDAVEFLKAKNRMCREYAEPEVDWQKVEIDTPILVRYDDKDEWRRRYFAGIEDNKVLAWKYGRTSWNNEGYNAWEQAKLAEVKNGQ